MKIKPYLLLLCLFFSLSTGKANALNKLIAIDGNNHIMKVLTNQENAWNKGDLDGFMAHYWKSENLQFVSKSGVKKGWQTVYDSYQKNYAAKNEMGKLQFNVLNIEQINGKNAMVTGSWKVENKSGIHQGFFTLWFKKINGNWFIVSDHTS